MSSASWQAIGAMGVLCVAVIGIIWKFLIAELRQELRANGGSSVKDIVTRIESEIVELKAEVNDLKLFDRRITRLESKMDMQEMVERAAWRHREEER